MTDVEIFTDAVQRGDREGALAVIERAIARSESTKDGSEVRELIHITVSTPFGKGR